MAQPVSTTQPVSASVPEASVSATFALSTALREVLDGNPAIQSAVSTLKAQEALVRARWGAFLPQVTAMGSYGTQTVDATPSQHDHPSSQKIVVSQQLTLGEETANLNNAKATARAAGAKAAATIQGTLLQTAQAYVGVLQAEEVVKQTAQLVENLQTQRRVAEVQFKTGEDTNTNVQQAQARLLGAQAELAEAKGNFATAKERLRALSVLVPDDAALAWPEMPKNMPETQPDDAILNAHPQLVAVLEKAESLRAQAMAVGSAGLPEVSANATAGREAETGTMNRYSDPVSARSIMLNVTVPLFRGGQVVSAWQGAKAAARAADYDVQDTRESLKANLSAAWATWVAAQAAATAAEQGLVAQTEATRGIRNEYKGGERSFLDALNAEQDLKQASVNLARAHANRLVAAYALLNAMGTLTADVIK
jgi:outer membrane protein